MVQRRAARLTQASVSLLVVGVLLALSMWRDIAVRADDKIPQPKWKCKVCEDVVQTWHDRYKCAGQSLELENERSNFYGPKATKTAFQSCRQPLLDCHDLRDELKEICLAMRFQFMTRKQKEIWEGITYHGNVYDVCVALGKCIDDKKQPDAKECREAYKHDSCQGRVLCAPVQKHCSTSCFICYNMVRDWPMFQEICKPPKARIVDEARPEQEKALLANGPPMKQTKQPPRPATRPRPITGALFLELNAQIRRAAKERQSRVWKRGPRPQDRNLQRLPTANPPTEEELTVANLALLEQPRTRTAKIAEYRDDLEEQQQQQQQPQYEKSLRSGSLLEKTASAGPEDGYGGLADAQDAADPEWQRELELQRRIQQEQQQQQQRPQFDPSLLQSTDSMRNVPGGSDAEDVEVKSFDDGDNGDEEQAPQVPVSSGDTLPTACLDAWDDIRYSKKARYFVQWLEEVSILNNAKDRMASGLWDANIVCKCLGQCELSRFEDLGVQDVCKYGQNEQVQMDLLLGEYIRDKPHKAISKEEKDEEEEEGEEGEE